MRRRRFMHRNKRKYSVVSLLLSICICFLTVLQASAGTSVAYFTDTEGWYREAIEYNVTLGIFQGTGRQIFSPNAPMTQAMVAAVLCRLSEVYAYGESYGDADYGYNWYARYEKWASEAQIIPEPESSYPQISDPGEPTMANKTVTREAFAVCLSNFMDYLGIRPPELSGWFADASSWNDYNNPYPLMESGLDPTCYPSQWAWPSYGGLREAGIIKGYPGYADFPGAIITRAEACQMLMRICEEYLFPDSDNEDIDPVDQADAYFMIFNDMVHSSKYIALDLTDTTLLTDIEPLVALVQGFCDENGYTLLLDTYAGLIEKGYISDESDGYGEYFREGYLIRLDDIQLTQNALVMNASYEQSALVGYTKRYTVRKTNGSWEITGNLIISVS